MPTIAQQFLYVFTAFMSATGYPTQQTSATSLCVELRSLLGEAPKDFRSIAGKEVAAALSTERRFEATRFLAGTDECAVTSRHGSSDYSCAWFVANEAELSKQYEELNKAATGCFPAAPLTKEIPGGSVNNRPKPTALAIQVSDRLGIVIRLWTRADTSARPRITLSMRYDHTAGTLRR